jgi:hypothetical protein
VALINTIYTAHSLHQEAKEMKKGRAVLLSVVFVVALVIAQEKTAPSVKQDAPKGAKVQAAGCCGMETAAKKGPAKGVCKEGEQACKGGMECCKKGAAEGKACCAEKMTTKAAKPAESTPKK